MPANLNKNVNWIDTRFWAFYVFVLLVLRTALYIVPFIEQQYCWTLLHIVHAIALFYLFHWTKGTPFWEDDHGEYDHLTFWEQIDGGVQYTPNRKFLTAVPIIMFLLAVYDTHWEQPALKVNIGALILELLPKVGFMHLKRLGGINAD